MKWGSILFAVLLGGITNAHATWVNDEGTWKEAQQVWVNDAGTWKATQQQWVNDAGTWKVVFTLNSGGLSLSFAWEIEAEAVATTSGYTVYLNDSPLCSATGGETTGITCLESSSELPRPAVFYMTRTDIETGESDPSNAIWAAGYPDWQESTVYALDDKVNGGDEWAFSTYMIVTVAGTSGTTQPTWPSRKTLSSAAIDNGDGTVNMPCSQHGFVDGDDVTLVGTTNYDGIYTLAGQGDPDAITITATYVAEDLRGYAVNKTVVDGGVTWTLIIP